MGIYRVIMVLIIANLIVFWPVIKNNKPVAVCGNLSSLSGNLTIAASTAPTGESSNGSGGGFFRLRRGGGEGW